MNIKKKILRYIGQNPGARSIDIAEDLEMDKEDIEQILAREEEAGTVARSVQSTPHAVLKTYRLTLNSDQDAGSQKQNEIAPRAPLKQRVFDVLMNANEPLLAIQIKGMTKASSPAVNLVLREAATMCYAEQVNVGGTRKPWRITPKGREYAEQGFPKRVPTKVAAKGETAYITSLTGRTVTGAVLNGAVLNGAVLNGSSQSQGDVLIAGLFSNGELMITAGADSIRLSATHTRELFAYLDKIIPVVAD